jgi:hypothetical protein
MKYLILSILITFTFTNTYARCGSHGIYSLSKSSTINKNGLIILEFYAQSQSYIQELNKKHPIYLKSNNDKIVLLPIEILKGEMAVTQVVLKPANDLIENREYTLYIDNLPEYEKPERYNERLGKWEKIMFQVNNLIDTEAPVLLNQPSEQKKTMVLYGCGPARWVYFALAGQDKSELFVKAVVQNKTSGLTTSYILSIENGVVKIGHGMCSGAFSFMIADKYEVSFQLFDQSGNTSKPTETLSFTEPTISANNE